MTKKLPLFLFILLLAFLARFIGLESLSPPLNRDEAAIGYNAYSLLQTGRDEHGEAWPLAFKSIGDYKMPGYIYATLIPVRLWGLRVFSVRFWAAMGGVLAVAAMWFLGDSITKRLPTTFSKSNNERIWSVSTWATLLLAINPWHIHYSRIGFEANLNLTWFLWALVFGVWGLKQARWWIGSALLLVMMQFTYSSSFIFLPVWLGWCGLVGVCYLFVNKGLPTQSKRLPWLPMLISVGILLVGTTIAVSAVARVSEAKQAITIFSDPYYLDQFNHLRSSLQASHPLWAKIWMNKPFYFSRIMAHHYWENFSPGFLFLNRITHPWHAVPGQGFFYWLDAVLLILGLGVLARLVKRPGPHCWFWCALIGWLVLSPIAAVITSDAPHATRSLYLLPMGILLVSLAIDWLQRQVRYPNHYPYLVTCLLVGYSLFFIRFVYLYLLVYPHYYDVSFFPGIGPVIHYLTQAPKDRMVVFDHVSDSPYLYVLFYGHYDPLVVQQEAQWKGIDTAGLTHIERVGQYWFVDGEPEVTRPALWVKQGAAKAPAGFTLEKAFTDERTGKIEWKVYKN